MCVCACVCVCVYVYMYVCMYGCIYVSVYVCIKGPQSGRSSGRDLKPRPLNTNQDCCSLTHDVLSLIPREKCLAFSTCVKFISV